MPNLQYQDPHSEPGPGAPEFGPLVIDSLHVGWWRNLLNEVAEMTNPPERIQIPDYPPAQPGEYDFRDPNVYSLGRPWWLAIFDTLGAMREYAKLPPPPEYPPALPGMPDLPPLTLRTLALPWWSGLLESYQLEQEMRNAPPLVVTSKPIQVKEIWGHFSRRRDGMIATACMHALVVLVMFGFQDNEYVASRSGTVTLVVPVDVSPYLAQLQAPPRPDPGESGGGGGGGANSPMPASRGKLPRFSLEPQLAPPSPIIRNRNPKLAVEPTVRVPPDVSVPNVDLSVFGDPFGADGPPSAGPGTGGGIGSGRGTGVGSGRGSGVGPGSGGGIGGGVFRIGGGVSSPRLLSKIEPEYSEEARKAKYQGVVMLSVEIWEDGLPHNIRVVRSLGLGLDEKAVEAVQQWRFSPGKKDGKPVRVQAQIEVSFRLL
ncbi:MAG: energy transducer TonB [Bryobacterales bacterium]|nr:energy transducer TonB [Bryobacterales bacterium]